MRCRAHTSRKPLDINRSKEAHFFSSRGRSELFTAELSAVGGAREKHKQTFPLIIGSHVWLCFRSRKWQNIFCLSGLLQRITDLAYSKLSHFTFLSFCFPPRTAQTWGSPDHGYFTGCFSLKPLGQRAGVAQGWEWASGQNVNGQAGDLLCTAEIFMLPLRLRGRPGLSSAVCVQLLIGSKGIDLSCKQIVLLALNLRLTFIFWWNLRPGGLLLLEKGHMVMYMAHVMILMIDD